ncbi:hypothetical protein J2Y73_003456 [Peribacillus frigoritolerans]|uniref:hypothetical protein n=1 Tax=Peribacillus frigoritolerans TaxID=450367 RepID=UPI00209E274A|nr:hypothetical protein [Peribacillus frigoritolerans]MCP1493425.1 hypothetical protein [Peribacillus frigoritolerans]
MRYSRSCGLLFELNPEETHDKPLFSNHFTKSLRRLFGIEKIETMDRKSLKQPPRNGDVHHVSAALFNIQKSLIT